MKLIHTGDLHLGRSLGEYDLLTDQKYMLDGILELARREKADALLIAGDVFDRSVPGEGAVRLLDYFLRKLADEKIPTFIISGNHDSDDRLQFGSSLFESSGIYISSVFDGCLHKVTAHDSFGEADIWMMPFVKASQVRHFFPEEKIETYEDAVRVLLSHAHVDKSRRNVLIAHQFVAGRSKGADRNHSEEGDWTDPDLAGSEGAAVQTVGLVERIGADCFDDFDYVALGHIHAPQRVGRDEVRYAGSPLKYSLSEAMDDKSVPVVTLEEKGSVHIRLEKLRPMRDLRHIRGPLRKLLAAENVSAPEDFIYATLTDEELINDVMGIIRQTYPNTVRIDYDNAHTRSIAQVRSEGAPKNKTFSALMEDFYREMYGCEISEEEMCLMKEVAGEAGVSDEAG